ncbi:glycosyltransferase family 2 protein [Zobellia nedashkovskayae]
MEIQLERFINNKKAVKLGTLTSIESVVMTKISVIVPVYNTELYLEKCVNSIVSQTFSDIEVILVNDGSSDSSPRICDELQQRDKRIYVIHQKNQGVSAARNAGMKSANGDFVNFVDSDDSLEPDMLELLYNNAINFTADISICSVRKGNQEIETTTTQPRALTRDEAIIGLLNYSLNWGAYNKLFKIELAQLEAFEGSINEDVYFCFRVFQKASSFVFEDIKKYNYAVNDNSVSMSRFDSRYLQMTYVADKILNKVTDESTEIIETAKYNNIIANISIANLILISNETKYKKELYQIKQKLRNYHSFILSNKKVVLKHRVAYILIRFAPKYYRFLLGMYSKLTNSTIGDRV